MKKKNIKLAILFLASVLICPSCLFQEEDIFDKPASERIDATLANLHTTLVSSTYGWKMAYDLKEKTCYRFFLKFTGEDSVSVLSDINATFSKTPAISTYSLKRSQGPVISFDTYNDQLSYLANPKNDNSTLGGDNDFVIYKITEDSIVLKGIKDTHKITMYRANEKDEDGYFKNDSRFKTLFSKTSSSPYFSEFTFGDGSGISIDIGGDTRYITFLYKNEADELIINKCAFDFNADGFNLWNPINVSGKTISHFIWNEEKQNFNLESYPESKFTFAHTTPFPYSNTVNDFQGKIFSLKAYSSWVKSSIFDPLISNSGAPYTTNSTTPYLGFEFAWNIVVDDNPPVTYFSFKVKSGSNDPNNYYTIPQFNKLREDWVSFVDGGGTFEGATGSKLNTNPYIKRLKDFLFSEEGFTVYDDGAGSVYFINRLQSTRWLQFSIDSN